MTAAELIEQLVPYRHDPRTIRLWITDDSGDSMIENAMAIDGSGLTNDGVIYIESLPSQREEEV